MSVCTVSTWSSTADLLHKLDVQHIHMLHCTVVKLELEPWVMAHQKSTFLSLTRHFTPDRLSPSYVELRQGSLVKPLHLHLYWDVFDVGLRFCGFVNPYI